MVSMHRRALLAAPALAALPAAPSPSGIPRGDGVHQPLADAEAALRRYAEVMARRADTAISDEACESWCEDETDAVQDLADAPAGDLETFLRLVEIIGDRIGEEQSRCLMVCELSLILAVGEQAKALRADPCTGSPTALRS